MQRLTDSEVARRALRKFPNHSQRAVARALRANHPKRFGSFAQAYAAVQRVVPTRRAARQGNVNPVEDRRKGTPSVAALPPLPDSHVEPWEPHLVEGRRILVLSDVHVPYHDRAALDAALLHGDTFGPDVVLLNGDIADFYRISRYQHDPDRRNFKQEIEAVRMFLGHLRARYPKARIVYKLGNHEERWWTYLWGRAPELFGIDVASFGVLVQAEQHRVEIVDQQRPIRIGSHLTVLHGHELPKGLTNPVNPARGAFLRALDIVLMGHQHRTSEHTETTMNGRMITCWSTGCLCDLNPEYMRINRHNHGFATVTVDASGEFSVKNHRIWEGKVL